MNKIDLSSNEENPTPAKQPETIMLTRQALNKIPQEELMKLLNSGSKVFLTGGKMLPVRLTLAEIN